MRLMGIDYGDARIGLATCDVSEILATALCTVNVTGMRDAVKKVSDKIKECESEGIVLGLPVNMDGTQSVRAEKTRAFAQMLTEATGLEIAFFDERLSTVEAYTYLNITDYKSKKRRSVIDALSAQIILQAYLDSKRK